MTNDMSVGKPGKVLMAFTLPMLLGNLFQQLYNMVDSIVVGNYEGADALAAVGTAFPIMMLVLCVVIGLTNGFSVVISQYFGAGQTEMCIRDRQRCYARVYKGIAAASVPFLGKGVSAA